MNFSRIGRRHERTEPRKLKAAWAFCAVACVLTLCIPAFSQLNLGRIFGSVTDQTGGALVGATVTVIDVARGISRPLIADGAGQYSAPSLTPGTYTVRAEAKGFKAEEHTDIDVGVGKDIRVDLTLQPGETTQTVTVTGDLPMVNTTNAQLGGTLEQVSVAELPVNGRNYQYLLATRPGVIMRPTGGQNDFVSNGTGTNDVVWMFDGLFDVNLFTGGSSIVGGAQLGPDEANILPLDAIQEVDTVENPKAEYGNRAGAQINVGLKSGTNSLHGTAYAFGRDAALNAKNPFLTANLPKAPLSLEQFGASVGGPIKKDKLFYFANYEGQRYSVGVPRVAQEPTTTSGSGVGNSIPDAVFAILQGNNTPSALSLNLSGCSALVGNGVGPTGLLTPTQTAVLKAMPASQLAAGCNATSGIFGNSGPNQNEVTDFLTSGGSDNGIVKIDYHLSDKNSLNFEFYTGGGNGISQGSVVQPYWASDLHTWSNVGRAVWIWTPSSSWLNEARFGYDYITIPIYVLECAQGVGPNYAALGFISGTSCDKSDPVDGGGFPVTTITGFTALGASSITQDNQQNYYSLIESLSYTHGKHQFKFGTEDRFMHFTGDAITFGRGTIAFGTTPAFTGATSLEDFLSGVTTSGQILVGNELRHVGVNSYAGYVQDDWRMFSRLTVNFGLRYEYTAPIKEANNLIGNFNPSDPEGLQQATNGHPVYKNYPWNFGPRLGLSWDVTGKGNTVVRAGAGLAYTTSPNLKQLLQAGAILNAIPTGFTFVMPDGSTVAGPGNIATGLVSPSTLPWAVNTPVFNAGVSGLKCGSPISNANPPTVNPVAPCTLAGVNPILKAPYYFDRTISIQHAFTNNLSIDVAYVGNHGSRLPALANLNVPTPGIKNTAAQSCAMPVNPPTASGTCISPFGAYNEQVRRPYYNQFPYYASINYETYMDIANYNALQVALNQRVTRGLNFSFGYTLSHNLDSNSTPMDPTRPTLEYGNSTNDARDAFSFTATYKLPGRKAPGQLLEGWQVNTTVNMLSGFPVNANDTSDDLSGTGVNLDRWTMSQGGNPRSYPIGGPGLEIPCYGVAGSSFSKANNCTTVATVQNMPSLCQTTAAAEAVNPNLPSGISTVFATGTQALTGLGCYLWGNTAIVPPAQGTYGTMARDALYGKGFRNWDFSATKNWSFRERYGIQFRAEFFNVLNRTQYSPSSANLSSPSTFGESLATPDSGNPVIGSGPRKIQFGLKLSF